MSDIDTPAFGALSPDEFMRRYCVGRTFFYERVKAGEIPLRKCGRRSFILVADAERWAASLPLHSAI